MFSKDIGIDLGTANTLVCLKGKGIILREPSVVAVDVRTDSVLAVGAQAKEMIGRTPDSIVAVRPLKDGVIADFKITAKMLQHFIKKSVKPGIFSKPRVIICMPTGVTEVERKAVEDAAYQAGAKPPVVLIEEPMAAAIGAGLPVDEPVGSMVVDIGGGTSEVAVISLGDIVTACSVRVAGDRFDEAILTYIKKKYNLLIGERTAEDIKIKIGSAYPYEDEGSLVDGEYTAEAESLLNFENVSVTIVVEGGKIVSVDVDTSSQSADYGAAAEPQFEEQILDAQGGPIDGVSGATLTSMAVKEAYADVLGQAA